MEDTRSLNRIDPHTFEDFYADRWRPIYQTLSVVLRNADLAREATDEAMVRAFQRWSTVRRYKNPSGWVYRVGLNWARSRLRKIGREQHGVPEEPQLPGDPPDPTIERALAELPLPQREVVVLHYLFDFTVPQIAEMIDIPEGTIKSRLHRALNRLRKELPDES
jgi:RNA polymerase sigma-70 factor (ECF subfamily)